MIDTLFLISTDEVAARLEDFNKKSSELYSNILAALGKNGVVSESQNMTAMAQQSTKIANDQVYTVVYAEFHSAFWIKMVQNG